MTTEKNDRIGWHFPPTSGGKQDGFMDAGMEYFTGSRMGSLAREIIQNSLDEQQDLDAPVEVSFEIAEMAPPNRLHVEELREHMESCQEEASVVGDVQATAFFENAMDLLQRPRMQFLRVSDRNTIGLRPEKWQALVKGRGKSVKTNRGSGGSFGIGKSAPFTVSGIRTVLYWTAYEEGGVVEERFQGVSILMSHQAKILGEGVETQGTGFLGRTEQCRALEGGECPEHFRYLGADGEPILGTSLWIAGMSPGPRWQRVLAGSIVSNYFYAIQHETLTILLEPDADENEWEISREKLPNWFEALAQDDIVGSDSRFKEARIFWELTLPDAGNVEVRTWDDPEEIMGRCRLLVRVEKGLPRSVGLIRKSGMLITSKQEGLQRFFRTEDFAAVCVFESEGTNEFLKGIENPRHDQFEPDRLQDEDEKRTARDALGRFVAWVRREIKEIAGEKIETPSEEPEELRSVLPFPDEDAPGPFSENDDESRERSFGGPVQVKHNQPKLRRGGQRKATQGPGPGPGESSHGPGEGDGSGGSGGKGGKARARVPVEDVRIIAVPKADRHRVRFLPRGTATVRLQLAEAGDSARVWRDDVKICLRGGKKQPLSSHDLAVVDGVVREVEVCSDLLPIAGRSWLLQAYKVSD